MKKKIRKITAALLIPGAMVIALTGCSGLGSKSETPTELTETTAENESKVDSKTVTDVQQDSTSSEKETESANVPEGFTERDFDSSYDGAVSITLANGATGSDAEGVAVEGNTVTFTKEGSYILKGELSEGQIIVDLPGENDKLQLVLDGVNITNSSSACIYVKNADKVFVTTAKGSENNVSTTGEFVQTDENNIDGAIFSKGDLVLNGDGSLYVSTSAGHGIVSKDDLKITGGAYNISAGEKALQANDLLGIAGGDINIEAGEDGLRSDQKVFVTGGRLSIASVEGIEATIVQIDDGEIVINAQDDGINATPKVDNLQAELLINGGDITINMAQGDTDALDSNGNLHITGGTLNLNAQSPFDYDGEGSITGGSVYVNGTQITELYNSMPGGGMMPGAVMQGGPRGGF